MCKLFIKLFTTNHRAWPVRKTEEKGKKRYMLLLKITKVLPWKRWMNTACWNFKKNGYSYFCIPDEWKYSRSNDFQSDFLFDCFLNKQQRALMQ
jgi:hypothetical protein